MNIGLVTVQVPFIRGGAEVLADELKNKLNEYGHRAEIISIPFKWYPTKTLYNSMIMGRLVDVTDAGYQKIDGIIGLKFPAYFAEHPNKTLWLVHQHRQAYDLWETKFGDLHLTEEGRALRKFIVESDNYFIPQYKERYTISQNVSNRLQKFNGIGSTALYHPPHDVEKLRCDSYEPFIFYPSRIDQMKRQWLLVSAAKHLRSNVKIKIAGTGDQAELEKLRSLIRDHKLENRVELLGRISDEDKIKLYATCRAVYFGCIDEDYGYITLEALFSRKPVIIHPDAGGPLEFVSPGQSGGFISPADEKELAKIIDQIGEDKSLSEKMGGAGYDSLAAKKISWENTIHCLTKALQT